MCEHKLVLVKAYDNMKGSGKTLRATYVSKWVCSLCGQPEELVYEYRETSSS